MATQGQINLIKKRPTSKTENIRTHLMMFRTITGKEAWKHYHLYRLSNIIFVLRGRGMNIKTEMMSVGDDTFAKYQLIKP